MSELPSDKPLIGITLGDYNGIGPEVILKALEGNQLAKLCTPVIYGSLRVLNQYRNLFEMKDWTLHGIQKPEQANPKLTNVITCWHDHQTEIQPGKVTPEAGQGSLSSLKRAVEDLKAGKIHAVVTGPINKDNIQSAEFKFPGHTEFLAESFAVQEALMFMVSGDLRVGVLSGHIPVKDVASWITTEKLTAKIEQMLFSLKNDFGIKKPKLAVLGLNPHAGENGLIGKEDSEIVNPAVQESKAAGVQVSGPFPADAFFGMQRYKDYDAILAMYHDQGLIPLKMSSFGVGVNFSAGLNIIRTSPDHGTAFDIAGKNKAMISSMLEAIKLAVQFARNRSGHD